MNIVDAQVHFGPGRIEETLSAMDALGIQAVLIDEYGLRAFNNEPHHVLPGGGIRPADIPAILTSGVHAVHLSARGQAGLDAPSGPGGGDPGYDVTDAAVVAEARAAVDGVPRV